MPSANASHEKPPVIPKWSRLRGNMGSAAGTGAGGARRGAGRTRNNAKLVTAGTAIPLSVLFNQRAQLASATLSGDPIRVDLTACDDKAVDLEIPNEDNEQFDYSDYDGP